MDVQRPMTAKKQDQPVESHADIWQVTFTTLDPERVSAELRLRLADTEKSIRGLEKAKLVSQETMQLEVSI